MHAECSIISFPHLDDPPIFSPQSCHCVVLHGHHGNGGEENIPKAAVEPVLTWVRPGDLQPVALLMLPTAKRIT